MDSWAKRILALSLAALAVRLLLSFLPGLSFDINTFAAWAGRLAEVGPGGFYTEAVWTHYTPGYLYLLWFLGVIGQLGQIVLKLPANLADIAAGFLIFKILEKPAGKKWALAAFAAYVFNPAIVFNSAVWGQVDGVLTLLLVASLYLLTEKKKPEFAAASFAFAFLIKPQAIALLPILSLYLIKEFPWPKLFSSTFAFLTVTILGSLAFFPQDPILGLPRLVLTMAGDYQATTLSAFNFWRLFGNWLPDDILFAGLPLFIWGGLLYLFFISLILTGFWQGKMGVYLASALSILAFFLFPTRVHERYLFPLFAFLAVAVGRRKSAMLWAGYGTFSAIHLANLYLVYAGFETGSGLSFSPLVSAIETAAPALSAASLVLFLGTLVWRLGPKIGEIGEIREIRVSPRTLLLALLAFSLAVRLIFLGRPADFYFDEVYHAFTAREYLRGNSGAWEWWTTPPAGFAYEWTHPPLAKYGMAAGMFIFGQNPFGWRFFGVLAGGISVFLVYLLGQEILKKKPLSLLAAALFAFDGLPLVMSRIGMNDIYFLLFALAAALLFIKKRWWTAGIFLGLALASKWTAVYLLPILAFWWLISAPWRRRREAAKEVVGLALGLGVLPLVVYLASYLPFFAAGHDLATFWGLQKQMWWYHTGLTATHPFTSPAWTWPVMYRPVWIYTSGVKDGLLANIYAMGNPAVWWAGLVAVGVALAAAVKKRRKELAFLLFAYFAFWLPWAASPRVMFIYHYLPAFPFLVIILAWVLGRIWEMGERQKHLVFVYLLVVFFLFLFFFPRFIGLPIPAAWHNFFRWFPTW